VKYEADVDALVVRMEPGDGTRYSFVVWANNGSRTKLMCAGTGDGAHFDGYEYSLSGVCRTIDECGQPGHVGHDSAGTYRAWAEHVMRTQEWLGYIVGHSNCNPWTAVAAMLAMWYAAKRFGMVVAP
jgi:hypothetical protein